MISRLKSLPDPEENCSCGGFEKYVKGITIKWFFGRLKLGG